MTLFFDANLSARVAKALEIAQAPNLECVTLSELYRDAPGGSYRVPDQRWIRDSALNGWLALTKDIRIIENDLERNALIEHSAGVVIFWPGNITNFEVLSFIVKRFEWLREINRLARPFVFIASSNGREVSQVDL